MVLQWKPVKGGPFAKLSFMSYGSHACTSLLPALHTCCHCDTLAERSLCSPGDQFKPWQHHTEPGCHLFTGTPETPLPICQGASEALCVHVYVWMWVGGKGGVREEVNQDLDADGSGRRACKGKECVHVCVREWMCGRGARSLCWFSFFFQDIRRIPSFYVPFFLQPGSLLPPMLPTFMLRQGWSERQKSGNQVNYGWWLADKSERKRARKSGCNIERQWDCRVFFYHLVECCWVAAASLTWPGRLFCQISCDAHN